jgi:hypothetical protein
MKINEFLHAVVVIQCCFMFAAMLMICVGYSFFMTRKCCRPLIHHVILISISYALMVSVIMRMVLRDTTNGPWTWLTVVGLGIGDLSLVMMIVHLRKERIAGANCKEHPCL